MTAKAATRLAERLPHLAPPAPRRRRPCSLAALGHLILWGLALPWVGVRVGEAKHPGPPSPGGLAQRSHPLGSSGLDVCHFDDPDFPFTDQEVHNPDNGGQGGAKLAPKASQIASNRVPKREPNGSTNTGLACASVGVPLWAAPGSRLGPPEWASSGQGGPYERDRTLKRSQRKSARRKACRRVRDEVPQCPPLRLLHPAREAGAPVHGTGIALHGDKSVRDREVKSPRDGDQAFIKSWQKLEAQRRSSKPEAKCE